MRTLSGEEGGGSIIDMLLHSNIDNFLYFHEAMIQIVKSQKMRNETIPEWDLYFGVSESNIGLSKQIKSFGVLTKLNF